MKVENISNFGKGLVEISEDPDFKKLKNQMAMSLIKDLYTEIGLVGVVKMMWKARNEKNRMRHQDWSKVEEQGFNKANLNYLIEDTAYMKVLVGMLGKIKACSLFSDFLEKTNRKLSSQKQNVLMIPANEMESCSDTFIAFKEFIKAAEDAMEKEGAHKIDIVHDKDDTLAFNVNYCIAHEVAKKFGDPIYCYPWCHIDDVALPKLGSQLGFKYERMGTLSSGAPLCDFKFSRI